MGREPASPRREPRRRTAHNRLGRQCVLYRRPLQNLQEDPVTPMDLHVLTKPAASCWHSLTIPPAEARQALLALETSAKEKLVMRVVRGGKATTTADFFDEIAAAL